MLYGKITQKRYLCRLIKLHYPNNNNATIMMIHRLNIPEFHNKSVFEKPLIVKWVAFFS